MILVVPDASILLKWVLPPEQEPDADRALALLSAYHEGRVELLVPPLWQYEVGNVLGLNYTETARARLEALVHLHIPEYPTDPTCRAETLRLVSTYGVTFYDASYHGLAILRQGVFLTADRRYAAKTEAEGHLALLAQWPPP